jgi:pyruvate/2-oxoglutarate/acetoin dehydrogenase E1 component
VFEHKLLYWSKSGSIEFDGRLDAVWQARRYTEGSDATVVAFGAMVHEALSAARSSDWSLEVINPFVLQPLAIGPILDSVAKTGRLLVVQECGAGQGLGDRVISQVVQQAAALKCRPRLVAAPDVPVPFAPELEAYYRPNASKIIAAIDEMLKES